MSADGTRAAVEDEGKLLLRTLATGLPIAHAPIAAPVAFGGTRVAAASGHSTIVLDADGTTRATIAVAPRELAMSADGSRVAIFDGASIGVWEGAELVATLAGEHALLDATGAHALTWRGGEAPRLHDVGAHTSVALAIDAAYRPLGFGEDRVVVIEGQAKPTGFVPGSASVWALDGTRVASIDGVRSATLDPQGHFLTTIGADRAVVGVWRVSDGGEQTLVVGEPLMQAQVDPAGGLIAGIGVRGTEVVVLAASDGRVLARWPIEHFEPTVNEDSFAPPAATAVWTRDGTAVITHAAALTVWNASSDVPGDVDTLARQTVPWQVVDGRLAWITGRLRGRVVHHDAPVGGVRVDASIRRAVSVGVTSISWDSMSTRVSDLHVDTDDDGTFELDGLFPGQYDVSSGTTHVEVYVSLENDPVELALE